jgi:hypothetical protein
MAELNSIQHPVTAAANAFALKSWHNTFLVYDEIPRILRHMTLGEMNRQIVHATQLFLDVVGSQGRLRLGSPNMSNSLTLTNRNTLVPVALGSTETWFDLVSVDDPAFFALRHNGLFACAEANGTITISQPEPREWEWFTLI